MGLRILLLFLLFPCIAYSNPYTWAILKVVDGDTIKVHAAFLPIELKRELSLRIYGVDTPEKPPRAKCKKESDLAVQATEFTKKLVQASSSHEIYIKEWDKYGGRVLGTLMLDGKDLRDELIKNGLAREYYGDAKQSWCE